MFAAIIGGALVVMLVLYILQLIRGALFPFAYAAVIVYLARPFVEMLAHRRVHRMLAVLIAYLIVFVFITLLMFFVIPVLIDQVNELVSLLPEAIEIGQRYISDLKIPAELNGVFLELEDRAGQIAISLASNLPQTAVGFFGGIFNIIIAWLLAFYILKDMPAINDTITGLLPERYRANILHIFQEVDFAVGGYLRGQVIVALAVGVMVTVWLLILGVDFALLLGVLAAVLNIVPYLGAIVGGGVAAIVAMFDSTQQAIAVIIGVTIIQQIDALIISPAVIGRTVNLHPTSIVFSLLVGASLFGFVGLLIAIPIAAALKAILLHYVFAKPIEIIKDS